jgi:hypothetical protein
LIKRWGGRRFQRCSWVTMLIAEAGSLRLNHCFWIIAAGSLEESARFAPLPRFGSTSVEGGEWSRRERRQVLSVVVGGAGLAWQ